MTEQDTYCPRRLKVAFDLKDGIKQQQKCDDECELYVRLELGPHVFSGCAEHIQTRMLGVIATRLRKATE